MPQNYATQVNKLVNLIMKRGKKNRARTILLNTLFLIKKRTKKNPLFILRKAFSNCMPLVTFVNIKKGSKTYKKPMPITEQRSAYFAASWIVNAARNRVRGTGKYTFANQLCDELIEDANGTGAGAKERHILYNSIIENRPFIR